MIYNIDLISLFLFNYRLFHFFSVVAVASSVLNKHKLLYPDTVNEMAMRVNIKREREINIEH